MSQNDPQMKLKVASYFLKHIPINEVKFALDDVKTLLNDEQAFNLGVQTQMLHDYNINQMVHVDNGNGKFILTPYNEVNAKTYYDPKTHRVFEVNHITKAVIAEVGTHQTSSHEKLRKAVEQQIDAYIDKFFKKEKCIAGVFVNDNTLVVCISAINTNLSAYWTGNWRTTYKVDLKNGKNLDAKLEANVHYFEDGNVQLNASFVPTENTAVDVKDAASIVKAIETIESAWQNNIEKMYVDMHHKTMKQMRRALPITRTTFNWSSGQHVFASEFGGASK